MIECKDVEVIKEIYKRSNIYELDDQVFEDWLDENKEEKETEKYITLKEILKDMQREEEED
jgi:hypothetical protein